jgi:hypothetical protein
MRQEMINIILRDHTHTYLILERLQQCTLVLYPCRFMRVNLDLVTSKPHTITSAPVLFTFVCLFGIETRLSCSKVMIKGQRHVVVKKRSLP